MAIKKAKRSGRADATTATTKDNGRVSTRNRAPISATTCMVGSDEGDIRFTATLHRPAGNDRAAGRNDASSEWAFVRLPKDASSQLPSRGQVSIDGTFNGSAFQATLEPDGQGGHWLKIDEKLRKAAEAKVGDEVTLEIAPMSEEPEPQVPADLKKALTAAPMKAREAWMDITPAARRDFIHWITSGKKAETRVKRIATACDMLAKGKRRPCCFDRSGMYDKSLSCPVADDNRTDGR